MVLITGAAVPRIPSLWMICCDCILERHLKTSSRRPVQVLNMLLNLGKGPDSCTVKYEGILPWSWALEALIGVGVGKPGMGLGVGQR